MIKELIGGPAGFWNLIQALLQEVLKDVSLADICLEGCVVRLLRLNRIYDLLLCLSSEGVRGSEHDVSEDPEGPGIDLLVIGLIFKYLRGHVELCTELQRGHMVLLKNT